MTRWSGPPCLRIVNVCCMDCGGWAEAASSQVQHAMPQGPPQIYRPPMYIDPAPAPARLPNIDSPLRPPRPNRPRITGGGAGRRRRRPQSM